MPVLYVTDGGEGRADFITDRLTIPSLFDTDGSAIIVHAKPDNYANIPSDRYDPDPDATTLATGDAGARIACGVIEPAGTSP
jgi:Cu-Zn family superoxide dismutase